MNAKNIAKSIHKKIDEWITSIEDKEIRRVIEENAIVTGGAIVSLLNDEQPNDYDIYFKTHKACLKVAKYYADKWNKMYPQKRHVEIHDDNGRVSCFIKSAGAVMDNDETGIDDESEPYVEESKGIEEKEKYRPKYFSSNAISLSDKIQLVIRFYGNVEEIHTNYDFVHCTCSYDYKKNKVELPTKALEAIINKELFYTGSKYPLCSIIRSRKFIERGWHINAGQYLKMCLQLDDLDLKNLEVFKDQLTGVDSAYFEQAIRSIQEKKEKEPDFTIDNQYLFEIINRIF